MIPDLEHICLDVQKARSTCSRLKELFPTADTKALTEALRSAIERSSTYARRNYRLAVPQYHPRARRVQLLLPLYFSPEDDRGWRRHPELVLCLKLQRTTLGEIDWNAPQDLQYLGQTVLKMHEAYSNARLLFEVEIESHWLEYIHEDIRCSDTLSQASSD